MIAKILLIEDNEDNRRMLARRLTLRGHELLTAEDGLEGIASAKANNPDLVLMNMSMPVLDGWEASRMLKADPQTQAIPILGLSANAMVVDREKALEAGCDDYDTKPVDMARLLVKMSLLLARMNVDSADRALR